MQWVLNIKKYIQLICYVHASYYINNLEEEHYTIFSKDTKNAFCKIYHALFSENAY